MPATPPPRTITLPATCSRRLSHSPTAPATTRLRRPLRSQTTTAHGVRARTPRDRAPRTGTRVRPRQRALAALRAAGRLHQRAGEPPERPVRGAQLGPGALLDDGPVVDDHDLVGAAD